MTCLDEIKKILELISLVITILGVPGAIFIFFRQTEKDRREKERELEESIRERERKEYETYHALDDKYIDFLKLCLANADLDIAASDGSIELSPQQVYRKEKLFEILISIFERAYVMYKRQDSRVRKEQWTGWNNYIEAWFENKNFQTAWNTMGSQWDSGFLDHMNKIFEKQNRRAAQ